MSPAHTISSETRREIELVDTYTAHNYAPLPIVVRSAEGSWVTDIDGRRFLDCIGAFSAVNFGHSNPHFLQVARDQLDRVTLTSRAVYTEGLGEFARALTELAGLEMALFMNTGAEANETAVKVARKWAYTVKGVPDGRAKVIGMNDNFHGRTISMVSLSTDANARADYAPYTPGFETVPFDDIDALAAAIDEDTAAVILEPIQGEAGVRVPSEGYLAAVRKLTRERRVLLICDEVQTGMGRTGQTFRYQHEGIVPDLVTVGKSLGAGIVPISAVIGTREALGVLKPGQHGSTFGGNPLAVALGTAVCAELSTGEPQRRSRELGGRLRSGLESLIGAGVVAVHGAALWLGVDLDPAYGDPNDIIDDLLAEGILAKTTHGPTVRIALPYTVTEGEIDLLLSRLAAVLSARRPGA